MCIRYPRNIREPGERQRIFSNCQLTAVYRRQQMTMTGSWQLCTDACSWHWLAAHSKNSIRKCQLHQFNNNVYNFLRNYLSQDIFIHRESYMKRLYIRPRAILECVLLTHSCWKVDSFHSKKFHCQFSQSRLWAINWLLYVNRPNHPCVLATQCTTHQCHQHPRK